ncbi:MAG: glycosyltransferase [Alphaproteobacteria bacterium]|nr:glycosyltransferase [Alphaproteobacteria bacterium]
MTAPHEIFLSIVVVASNQQPNLQAVLRATSAIAQQCSLDHEIVVVDNGSDDGSVDLLQRLCGEDGIPNLQIYVLTKKVEADVAAWAGVENALGDYVAVIDPTIDDINALPSLLAASMEGADVVFAAASNPPAESLAYRIASNIFGATMQRLLKVDTRRDVPFFRVLSRKVVNYMLRHDASGMSYRWLPAASGFRKASLTYDSSVQRPRRNFFDAVDRGARMMVSSNHGPMRVVTLLSLFGAVMNLIYSAYVIVIALIKEDVAPGWVTLSLQQSGMFLLISLVLLLLGEYILHITRLATNAPSYYVADEFTSAVITRKQRLNVEANTGGGPLGSPPDAVVAPSE